MQSINSRQPQLKFDLAASPLFGASSHHKAAGYGDGVADADTLFGGSGGRKAREEVAVAAEGAERASTGGASLVGAKAAVYAGAYEGLSVKHITVPPKEVFGDLPNQLPNYSLRMHAVTAAIN